ncbi:DinB family protein [Aquimarina sp. 2201CG5-10]|uniref:DinB family protein n=1 Tax=Aquimarina callyspongiae TaxID=3098150 RepID=UPI002AB5A1AA|nr:DinB family protein [Aquimarina sp. 2201CG5-10]MDY8137186.1 DinB family protein [Aquimarina sp. 2201CG5-10]
MDSIEIILLNFSEIRRRSIKLWQGIPEQYMNWKPDKEAFSIIEMIRHVLEGEHLYHKIIENKGNLGDYASPWQNRSYSTLREELKFAEKYRNDFINMIKTLTVSDLENISIKRTEVGQIKKLGDYLNRIAYHESVHTGQMLHYLRIINIERPLIWD